MAHTFVSTDNRRGNQVTAANPSFAHIRGWNAGVRVEARDKGTRFEVYMTSGSSGDGLDAHIGTVELTANGPEFTRAVGRPSTLQLEVVNARELLRLVSAFIAEVDGAYRAAPVSDLWQRIQALAEENGGEWPGADVVDILTQWFTEQGYEVQ